MPSVRPDEKKGDGQYLPIGRYYARKRYRAVPTTNLETSNHEWFLTYDKLRWSYAYLVSVTNNSRGPSDDCHRCAFVDLYLRSKKSDISCAVHFASAIYRQNRLNVIHTELERGLLYDLHINVVRFALPIAQQQFDIPNDQQSETRR